MNVVIRPELTSDADDIAAVTEAAFRDAAHTDHTEHFIVAALRAAGALSVSLVAQQDGRIVGHVAVSTVAVSDGARGWYGLGPISVLPAMQGRGIGERLMRSALTELKDNGAAGCVLLGDPAYYQRFGFKAEPRLVLPGVPAQYFQALAFGASLPRGIVSYHAAFNVRS